MRKIIFLILGFLLYAITSYGICCEKNQDCIIQETCLDGNCGDCSITIYNESGNRTVISATMNKIDIYLYQYNASRTLSYYAVYPYVINCSQDNWCSGDCNIQLSNNCGGKSLSMELAITIFILGINLLVFVLPFVVKFSKNNVTHYTIKHLCWIAAIFLLWYNTTIFRTMAIDQGLNIDELLMGYWWILTTIAFLSIFVMVYVMIRGIVKMLDEAKTRIRMGEADNWDNRN